MAEPEDEQNDAPAPEPDVPSGEADSPETVDVTTTDKKARGGHTWPQRALLSLNVIVVLGCFAGAAGLIIGRHYGNSIPKVALPDDAFVVATTEAPADGGTSPALEPGETLAPGASTTAGADDPTNTFPPADPEAKNFLITGADNNACIDPNSPYAKAFGDRTAMGERSDTVMIMRVDPTTKKAAILSFPRDLWVSIPGRGKQRINAAYVKDDPSKLIYTIVQNFGVGIDHFIQIDFCAFKKIVDSIEGGVGVPFTYPARDSHTGLNVPEPGCYYFDGESALAYVRSRYYQYFEDGKWKSDPVSDLGRISRQQDFIRRVLTAALNEGLFDPQIASGLINVAQNNVLVDDKLTLAKMLEFVGVLRDIEPGGVATYQIEAVGRKINGNAVLEPKINGENMQAILRIFKGEAPLADPPAQVFETTTTSSSVPSSTPGSTTVTTVPATTATTAPTETVPGPTENVKGIVPPRDVTCP